MYDFKQQADEEPIICCTAASVVRFAHYSSSGSQRYERCTRFRLRIIFLSLGALCSSAQLACLQLHSASSEAGKNRTTSPVTAQATTDSPTSTESTSPAPAPTDSPSATPIGISVAEFQPATDCDKQSLLCVVNKVGQIGVTWSLSDRAAATELLKRYDLSIVPSGVVGIPEGRGGVVVTVPGGHEDYWVTILNQTTTVQASRLPVQTASTDTQITLSILSEKPPPPPAGVTLSADQVGQMLISRTKAFVEATFAKPAIVTFEKETDALLLVKMHGFQSKVLNTTPVLWEKLTLYAIITPPKENNWTMHLILELATASGAGKTPPPDKRYSVDPANYEALVSYLNTFATSLARSLKENK